METRRGGGAQQFRRELWKKRVVCCDEVVVGSVFEVVFPDLLRIVCDARLVRSFLKLRFFFGLEFTCGAGQNRKHMCESRRFEVEIEVPSP